MKRFFIFLLLGPLLGYLAGFIAVTLPENSFLILLIITLPLLPYVYLVGVGPALIVSMLDASLERRAFRWRIAACAIAGYAGSYAVCFCSARGCAGSISFCGAFRGWSPVRCAPGCPAKGSLSHS